MFGCFCGVHYVTTDDEQHYVIKLKGSIRWYLSRKTFGLFSVIWFLNTFGSMTHYWITVPIFGNLSLYSIMLWNDLFSPKSIKSLMLIRNLFDLHYPITKIHKQFDNILFSLNICLCGWQHEDANSQQHAMQASKQILMISHSSAIIKRIKI